jgi:peptidoglycan/LPS O-acetylase OafA/YrhL
LTKVAPAGSSVSRLSYRPEIDGLRAIAVISVILYHAQLMVSGKKWFEGGYIGVDIFFVISGYLITRIILFELREKGTFSFSHFYERRARRILPMLFLVILVSIPFAWQKLLPSDFVEYAESILSSIFFGSNFFFYFNTTEYGADSALLKPFLHTWSLGVEEQFYIVFPILALVSYKFFRRHFLAILVVLSLLSLLFAELMEVRNPDLNFYLPVSRFWELSVGSILAVRELFHRDERNAFWGKLFPVLGLCLVVYAIVQFDAKTPHPGFHTIIPILGVALIIGFTSQDALVGKVLASRPFVWMGLISYSAYLWHFPIFAFSRSGATELTNYDKFGWITLTLVLSLASYWAIERTFRNRELVKSPALWTMLGVSVVSLVAFMSYAVYSDGAWDRYSKVQQGLIAGLNEPEFRALKHPLGYEGRTLTGGKAGVRCYSRDPEDACRFGNEKIVFLGDSYVGQYERAIVDEAKKYNLGFVSLTYGECPFVSNDLWFGSRAECPLVNEKRKKVVQGFSDRKIFIVSANYNLMSDPKKRTDHPLADGKKRRRQGESAEGNLAWESYFQNIRWLTSMGHKVVLLRTIPTTTIDGSRWLGNNLQYLQKMDFPAIYNGSKPSALKMNDDNRFPDFDPLNVLVLNPGEVLCDTGVDKCFDVMPGVGPLYNSDSHLSYAAASLVAKQVGQGILRLGWDKL